MAKRALKSGKAAPSRTAGKSSVRGLKTSAAASRAAKAKKAVKAGRAAQATKATKTTKAGTATKAAPKKKAATRRRPAARVATRAVARPEGLFGKVAGAESRNIGHVQLDVGRAGNARVKRLIYPAGFRWSTDMKPAIGGDYCQHAHVGFLAHGEIHIEYPDGCVIEHRAPHVICIEPGHDGWVVGSEPVVMIEIDFEGQTVEMLGMPGEHRH